jgi:hypothetical protein
MLAALIFMFWDLTADPLMIATGMGALSEPSETLHILNLARNMETFRFPLMLA